MKFASYLVGGFLFIVFYIIYQVIRTGGIALTQAVLIDISILALIATISFAIAGYFLDKNS